MRRVIGLAVVVAMCVACGPYGGVPRPDLPALARAAVSEDRAEAARSIAALRSQGPAGLTAVWNAHLAAIEQHRANPTRVDAAWTRIAAALDGVAAQKDAWAAGLYWYTDMEDAKAAAARAGKPILSLRLLGTLDTEFSCANSRFFRTVLYANEEVGRALRDGFVLHWQSHRPVPRLTIDFGDGRTIERTITGNSVHYVLTPTGRAVDVIPGLYGPAAFLRALREAAPIARTPDGPQLDGALPAYHAARLQAVRAALARDLLAVRANASTGAAATPELLPVRQAPAQPTAMNATRLAVSKARVEVAAVTAVAPDPIPQPGEIDDATWVRIAQLHAADGRLDAGSRAVVRAKLGNAVPAGAVARTKAFVEDPIVRIVARFEASVAVDGVRNEYLLHARVHEWFASRQAPAALDDLNERVYAELFLMPKSDPWLGLVPPDAYTGLPADAKN